ncbi:MAG: 16S rRNA (guanine(966)-N(2))-methyltransferase RsmD [Rhodospirillales bacterium]|nr:16S rRNA (guanine(966)-N(2))-methyltransferase RsmD [Rhodospirillales bacterium]
MRITAGLYRGRRLSVPKGLDVRPTTDMVRQAVFNMLLKYDLPVDAVVLDGFCGSGSLGLESLSRGAAACIFIDKDIQPARDNARAIGIETVCTFLKRDVRKAGVRPESMPAATLAFLDPPYRRDLVLPALAALATGGWLTAGGMVVVEAEKQFTLCPPAGFSFLDARPYGDSQIIMLRYKSAPEE